MCVCAGGQRQKKRGKQEQTDSVDQLAKQYLSKYFDAGPTPKKSGAAANGKGSVVAASQRAAMKRWFE